MSHGVAPRMGCYMLLSILSYRFITSTRCILFENLLFVLMFDSENRDNLETVTE